MGVFHISNSNNTAKQGKVKKYTCNMTDSWVMLFV